MTYATVETNHPHLPPTKGPSKNAAPVEQFIPISMSPLEQKIAFDVGRRRNKTAKGPNAHDKNHTAKQDQRDHCVGALGEMAVAKHLNLYWDAPIDNYKGADIGDKIEVKTRKFSNYDLLCRKDDKISFYYVLAVSGEKWLYTLENKKFSEEDWTVFIVGWRYGEYCFQDKYQSAYGRREKAWFVWQNELHTDYDRLLAHIYEDRRSVQSMREYITATGNRLARIDSFLENGPDHPEADKD